MHGYAEKYITNEPLAETFIFISPTHTDVICLTACCIPKKIKEKKKKYKNILKAHIFIPAQLQIGLNRHKVKFNGYLL